DPGISLRFDFRGKATQFSAVLLRKVDAHGDERLPIRGGMRRADSNRGRQRISNDGSDMGAIRSQKNRGPRYPAATAIQEFHRAGTRMRQMSASLGSQRLLDFEWRRLAKSALRQPGIPGSEGLRQLVHVSVFEKQQHLAEARRKAIARNTPWRGAPVPLP
ncbi:MAG: hypothetical protein ABIZ80_11260, partial [Bryobacteraceae bacterium]